MKLLVYEHASGGGFADGSVQSRVLSEGFGMLRTLTSDLKAAGHSVSTMLDSRLAALNPPLEADCIVRVSSSRETEAAIQKISQSADAAFIIAPESNRVLQTLVNSVERTGVPSLNCQASTIEKVSDKAMFQKRAKTVRLPIPTTMVVSALENVVGIKRALSAQLEFPLIFKPVDGIGCCGLSVVRDESQVAGAVDKIIRESSSEYFMVQELVDGIAVSVSLICTESEALPISLNKQDVSLMTPEAVSTYNGGLVPFDSALKREAFATAEKTVRSFRGLRGYVGVDLILTENGPVVIEVNPRLTTSYVGLRKVVSINLAQAIISSVLERELPANIQSRGYAFFSKVQTSPPTTEALQKTYMMDELVSPPFPAPHNGSTYALILSHRPTLKEATVGFHEAKKRLLSITASGG